jgi:hypothetical protein
MLNEQNSIDSVGWMPLTFVFLVAKIPLSFVLPTLYIQHCPVMPAYMLVYK